MQKIIALFSVLMLLVLPVGAEAAIDAAGALELKKQVEEGLQSRLNMAKVGGHGLTMSGPIEVTPKEGFYEVTLPQVAVTLNTAKKLEVGTVTFKATPGQPGQWVLNGTLPMPLTFLDEKGVAVSRVTMGKQSFSGTWAPVKDMFLKADTLCEDIVITGIAKEKEKSYTGTIKSLKSALEMKENADGTWGGGNQFDATAIKLEVPGEKTTIQITLAGLTSHGSYDRLDLKQMLESNKKMQEIIKSGQKPTDEELRAMSRLILSSQGMMDGASNTFEANGFSLQGIPTNAAEAPKGLSFDKLSFVGNMKDIRLEKAKADLKLHMEGLKTSFAAPELAGLVPSSFNADFGFENLPIQKMIEALLSAAEAAQAPAPAPVKGAAAPPVRPFPALLKEAHTTMNVRDFSVISPDLEQTMSGKIEGDPAATLGVTGDFFLVIKGLHETIEKLRTYSGTAKQNPQLMGYMSVLTAIEMMGQADQAQDGRALRTYKVAITPDGKMLLNGVDFKMVAQGLGAGQDKPADKPLPKRP